MKEPFEAVLQAGNISKNKEISSKIFKHISREKDSLTETLEHGVHASLEELPGTLRLLLSKHIDISTIIKEERKFKDMVMKNKEGTVSLSLKHSDILTKEGLDLAFLRPGCYWQGLFRIRNSLAVSSSTTDTNTLLKMYMKFCDFSIRETPENLFVVANLKLRTLFEELLKCSSVKRSTVSTEKTILSNLEKLWFVPTFSPIAMSFFDLYNNNVLKGIIRIVNKGVYEEKLSCPAGLISKESELMKIYNRVLSLWEEDPPARTSILRFLAFLSLDGQSLNQMALYRENESEINRYRDKAITRRYIPSPKEDIEKTVMDMWSGNYFLTTEDQHVVSRKILERLKRGAGELSSQLISTYLCISSKQYSTNRILDEIIEGRIIGNSYWIVPFLIGRTVFNYFLLKKYASYYIYSEESTAEGILQILRYMEITKGKRDDVWVSSTIDNIMERDGEFKDEEGKYKNNVIPKLIEFVLEKSPELEIKKRTREILSDNSDPRVSRNTIRVYKKMFPLDDFINKLVF